MFLLIILFWSETLEPFDHDDEPGRPGALSHAQLEMLQAKSEELRTWIGETAKEFHVSRATISTNMGLHEPERRITSFWNKFQTVYYARLSESLEIKETEKGEFNEEVIELFPPSKSSEFLTWCLL
jgi:hypothetical protein